MKSILQRVLLMSSLLLLIAFSNISFAQPPAPPAPPSGNGKGGNQGKGAPLDDGVEMSLLLAAVYAGYILSKRKKNAPELGQPH